MRVCEARASAAVAFGVAALLWSGVARGDASPPGRGAAAIPSTGDSPEPPPRPPLADAPPPVPLPWERHLEFGPDLAFVALPATADAEARATSIRFSPAIGFALHLNIELLRYLRFTTYLVDSRHAMSIPPGSLGPLGTIEDGRVHTFRFGARVSPTLPLTERVRLWATAGMGWGRLEFSRMTVTEPGKDPFTIRERADGVLEVPLGIGASFEVVPRWLSVQLELTYAFDLGQEGTGQSEAQAIDAAGKKRGIGGLPRLSGLLVQTLGVSLLL
jgi:hypothetical protein